MENEDIPRVYSDANDEIKKIIIILGTSCYCKLLQGLSEEEILNKYGEVNKDVITEMYEKQIDHLKNQIDDNFVMHKKELTENAEKIISTKEIELKELKKRIIILQSEFENNLTNRICSERKVHERIVKNHEDNITNLKEKNVTDNFYKDGIIEKLQEENKNKQNVIDKYIGQREFIHNTEQGDVGEKFIDDVVNNGLSFDKKATIEDSSKNGGSGDRIITYHDNTKTMVEVKNKGVITKEDMEQFETHYKRDFDENKCQNALFISLQTEQIPHIGNSPILHFHNNVGYLGLNKNLTPDEKKLRIERGIHEIYERYVSDKDVKHEAVLDNSIYNELLESYYNKKEECENNLKKYTKKSDTVQKELTSCNQKINELYRKIQKNNIMVDEKYHNEEVFVKGLIEKIRKWNENSEIVLKKQTFKKIIIENMDLSELDHKFIKKIKFIDL